MSNARRLLTSTLFTLILTLGSVAHSAPQTAAPATSRAALLATRVAADPALAAIADLLALERLYRAQRNPDAIRQLYTDVLGRSADPRVQNFAQRRLARLEYRQGDPQAAERLLKENLERNLARGEASR